MQDNAERWFLENVLLLSDRFGRDHVVADGSYFQYILITNYQLPYNWRQRFTRLLIRFHDINTIFYLPPDNFYLNKGLRTVRGSVPCHYYEGNCYNDLGDRGLARFSFHIKKGWFPKLPAVRGTTLVHVLGLLHQGMLAAANEDE